MNIRPEAPYSEGNESAANISGALGMFHVGWRRPVIKDRYNV